MSAFRKKPVVIDAFQLSMAAFNSVIDWPDWAQEACEAGIIEMHGPDGVAARIKTPEGTHDAAFDDWIIRGVKGELYPCKPDIFAATYERVDELSAAVAAEILAERRRQIEA